MTSECTVSCGGGTKRGVRKCTNPKPMNGGESCRGDNTSTLLKCKMALCPGMCMCLFFL